MKRPSVQMSFFVCNFFLMNCKWFPNYRCIFVCRILTLVLSHSRVVISSTFWFNLTILIVITVFSEGDVPQLLASLIVFSSLLTSPSLCVSSVWLHGKAGWKREVERYRVSSRAAQYSDRCPERGNLCAVSGPGNLAPGLLQRRKRKRTCLIQHCGSR